MLSGTAIAGVLTLLSLAFRADAHGYLKQPKPSWVDDPDVNWITLIDNYWDIGSGGDQCGLFKTMAEEKGMSVRDVVLDMVGDKTCGNTVTNVDPQPVPSDGKAIWVGGEENGGGGFTHRGPCELYIDDKMVLKSDDCSEDYPTDGGYKNSEMPVDFSSCNGDCIFTIYWLGFQNEQWQAYINCVPLKGTVSSTTASSAATQTTPESSSNEDSETETATTEAASNEDSKNETDTTQAASTENESQSTEAPAAATEAPATDAPTQVEAAASETTKCSPARRFRK